MRLGIGILNYELRIIIENLGLESEMSTGDWDWRIGLGMGIEIGIPIEN